MTHTNYAKVTAWLIAAWFAFCLSASALHAFKAGPNRLPLTLGVAVLVPILVFLLWFTTSEQFRQFTYNLNPRALTMVQSLRIAGFTFLVLYTYGILPGAFALPAGWGDIAIGVTAPLVAMKLTNSSQRTGFIVWQVLGVLDLVAAVSLGTTARLISPEGIATSAMSELPLSLIPTFAVPLFLVLHLICIAQARRWEKLRHSHIGEQLPSSAV
jgi:hypothetical protein